MLPKALCFTMLFNHKGKITDLRDFVYAKKVRNATTAARRYAAGLAYARDFYDAADVAKVQEGLRRYFPDMCDEEAKRARTLAKEITFEPVAFWGMPKAWWPAYLHDTPDYQRAPDRW